MGASCCCIRMEDLDEYANPNNSIYRHCLCLGCFIWQFLNVYSTLFQRGDVHAAPSSIQEATPVASSGLSTGSVDSSFSDRYRSPPRPLPYDADPRYTRLQHDGQISRHEKASSHIHEESQPLRRSTSIGGLESVDKTDKWSVSDCEGRYFDSGSTVCCSESSVKHSSPKITRGVAFFFSSSEDEDVCPTCLEEYTPENPKITTQCSHHFHLGCIYEWMERSETCPVCGQVMVFDETT